jgi:hypothetical protein
LINVKDGVARRLLLFPGRNFSVRPRDYKRRASNHFRWAAFSVGTAPLIIPLNGVGRDSG